MRAGGLARLADRSTLGGAGRGKDRDRRRLVELGAEQFDFFDLLLLPLAQGHLAPEAFKHPSESCQGCRSAIRDVLVEARARALGWINVRVSVFVPITDPVRRDG